MTIWIAPELPLLNFERLDILCAWIGFPSEKLWPFEFIELPLFNFVRLDILCAWIGPPRESYDNLNFSRAFVAQFRESRYIMCLNRISEWNVMTIQISRELPLFNIERLDELCPWIGHLCEMLWPFKFLESFRCSISSVSIYYVPESDVRVKCYDHSNLSRASVVQFRASRWVMSPNRTSVWKVMTIRLCRELPVFNLERLDILCPRIGHPSEILWPFEFLESFRCSISSV